MHWQEGKSGGLVNLAERVRVGTISLSFFLSLFIFSIDLRAVKNAKGAQVERRWGCCGAAEGSVSICPLLSSFGCCCVVR